MESVGILMRVGKMHEVERLVTQEGFISQALREHELHDRLII
jgi:hypothetical protein